jgi:hypothetical protein
MRIVDVSLEIRLPRTTLPDRSYFGFFWHMRSPSAFTPEKMEAAFPLPFDGANNSNSYVLTQLPVHLNYHLGQVNYLRRMLE